MKKTLNVLAILAVIGLLAWLLKKLFSGKGKWKGQGADADEMFRQGQKTFQEVQDVWGKHKDTFPSSLKKMGDNIMDKGGKYLGKGKTLRELKDKVDNGDLQKDVKDSLNKIKKHAPEIAQEGGNIARSVINDFKKYNYEQGLAKCQTEIAKAGDKFLVGLKSGLAQSRVAARNKPQVQAERGQKMAPPKPSR